MDIKNKYTLYTLLFIDILNLNIDKICYFNNKFKNVLTHVII